MSNKTPLLLLLTLPLLTLFRTGYAQDKWDLRKCVDYAIANNISVKQADVQARIARLTLQQSKLSQLPTLTVNSEFLVQSGNTQNPNNFSLITQTYAENFYQAQANVNAFNFFSLRRSIDANRYSWQAALANSDKTKNDLTLNVANAYLQVLLAMEQTEATHLQLRLSQNQLELTRKQVLAGTLPELNAAELESQVAQDSATYIGAQGTVTQNLLQLKAYMDLDASVPFDVYAPPVEDIPVENIADLQPEAVYSLALANQPLQKMDAFQIQSAQNSVKATRGAMYPTFSILGNLQANYTSSYKIDDFSKTPHPSFQTVKGLYTGGGDSIVQLNPGYPQKIKGYFSQLNQTFGQYVGVGVSIPILDNGILRTNYAKSKLTLRNQQLQRDQDNLTLKNNIYQAYTQAITALHKFEANKITVTATQKSFDFAQKRYAIGMSNTIDLLTNQNNFFNARINLLSSQFDYVFKMKVLEYYKGLGVKLTKD